MFKCDKHCYIKYLRCSGHTSPHFSFIYLFFFTFAGQARVKKLAAFILTGGPERERERAILSNCVFQQS